jgi:hypothetical protein
LLEGIHIGKPAEKFESLHLIQTICELVPGKENVTIMIKDIINKYSDFEIKRNPKLLQSKITEIENKIIQLKVDKKKILTN